MKIVSVSHNKKMSAWFLMAMTCLASVSASLGGETVTSAEVKAGMRAFAKQDFVLLGGPDKGKTLRQGWMINCSRVDADRVWASGSVTGWVPKSNLVSFAAAEEYWKRAAVAEPLDPKQLIILARIQTQLGKPAPAIAALTLAKKHTEIGADIRVISVIADAQSIDLDAARQDQIISLCESSRLTDYNAALLLSFLSDYGDLGLSEKVFSLMEMNTAESSCWLLGEAARVRAMQGNDDEAIGLLNEILRRDQWYATALIHRSIIFLQQDRLDEATADAERYVQLKPNIPLSHRQLGACYFKAGHWQKGMASLRRALEVAPNNPTICYSLGTRLIESALSRGAPFRGPVTIEPLKLLKKSCELTKYRNLDYVHQLAFAYAAAYEPTRAEELLKHCYKKYGHLREYRDLLDETRSMVDEIQSLDETRSVVDELLLLMEASDE